MSGFIYVMSNPSIPDRIKIGKSERDPTRFRKQELYSTGVPEPFTVEYFAHVLDCDADEVIIHKKLKKFRPNKNREFFTCSIPHAIVVIQENATVKDERTFYKSLLEIKHEKQKQIEQQDRKRRLQEKQKREELKRAEEEEQLRREKRESERVEREKKKQLIKTELTSGVKNLIKFLFLVCIIWGGWAASFYIAFEFFPNGFGVLLCMCSSAILFFAHNNYLEKDMGWTDEDVTSKPRQQENKSNKLSANTRPIKKYGFRPSGDSQRVIMECTNCGRKNRISKDKLGQQHIFKPICAVCKKDLKS